MLDPQLSHTQIFFYSAPTISGFPSETRCEEGEEVVIRAKVRGHPTPTITWYHDGKPVATDYATEMDKDGGLAFPSVEAKHAGEHTHTHTHTTHTLLFVLMLATCLVTCFIHVVLQSLVA